MNSIYIYLLISVFNLFIKFMNFFHDMKVHEYLHQLNSEVNFYSIYFSIVGPIQTAIAISYSIACSTVKSGNKS